MSIALFVLPFIFNKDIVLYATLPLLHFLAVYFFLLNFPGLVESLHSRPLYIEDLEIASLGSSTPDRSFRTTYSIVMNFILAVLFAGITEYVVLNDIRKKPVVEALGIIGGNLGLYYKLQDCIGSIIIYLCYNSKIKALSQTKESSIKIAINQV